METKVIEFRGKTYQPVSTGIFCTCRGCVFDYEEEDSEQTICELCGELTLCNKEHGNFIFEEVNPKETMDNLQSTIDKQIKFLEYEIFRVKEFMNITGIVPPSIYTIVCAYRKALNQQLSIIRNNNKE